MTRIVPKSRMIALAASTALASLALAGCASTAAPRADLSAGKAQKALEQGRGDRAVAHAESAVQADPHNATYRAMLGSAYMEAGRFLSAETSFQDALTLGDTSPRTALGLALAQIGRGDMRGAQATLDQWRGDIDPADLGLALALAGQPQRGIQVLGSALRDGNSTPKVRQNLAYAYALNGDWRAARIMAAEDVPADQLDDRIGEWASVALPEQFQARVATLLAVPVVADSGQPVALALHNNPRTETLALEAAATTEAEMAWTAPEGELPALAAAPDASVVPAASTQSDFTAAFTPATATATPTLPATNGARFAATPVVQDIPAVRAAEPRRIARAVEAAPVKAAASGTHLVQLGSFSSEAGAKRAWGIYAKRYPQLSAHDMVITRAVVHGKTYFRVSAAGFGRDSSRSMCSRVKSSGNGCIAWAANSPLPGAVDRGVRMASR